MPGGVFIFTIVLDATSHRPHSKCMSKNPTSFTDLEEEVLDSIGAAYEEDPNPLSGRTYMADEAEYETAMALLDKGLLREVTSGVSSNTRWAHFGLTDDGFTAVEAL